MLDILELPKTEPVNDHTERSVDHRYRKQGREAHAIASQEQLRRARENMRQRDGEDKGYKDADVLKHMSVLWALRSHGPTCSCVVRSCWNAGSLRIGSHTGSIFKRAMETVSPAGMLSSRRRIAMASDAAPVRASTSARPARLELPRSASLSGGSKSTACRASLRASASRLSAIYAQINSLIETRSFGRSRNLSSSSCLAFSASACAPMKSPARARMVALADSRLR